MGTGILKLMKNASHSCCSFSTRFIVQKKTHGILSKHSTWDFVSHRQKNGGRAHKSKTF